MHAAAFSGDSWQLSAASVRGKSHVDGGLPNQDCVCVVTDGSGEIACAVVSDGAGTAARSQEGAQLTAKIVAQWLCGAGERARGTGLDEAGVRAEVEAAVAQVRASLALQGELHDFHCTLVAWLALPGAGFVVQVGDSVGISTCFGEVRDAGAAAVDFFPQGAWRLYEPERGEYSNETHFVTEADWTSHLRVSRLPPGIDALILMTDGAMDVAMLRGEVFRGFLSNLLAKLLQTPGRGERDEVIHAWLDDPQTHRVTGDDKTLFVAIRGDARMPDGDIFLGQRKPAVPAEAAAPARAPIAASPVPAMRAPRAPAVPATAPTRHARRRRPLLVASASIAALAFVLAMGPSEERKPANAAAIAQEAARAAPVLVSLLPPPVQAEAQPVLAFAGVLTREFGLPDASVATVPPPAAQVAEVPAPSVELEAPEHFVHREATIRVTGVAGPQTIERITADSQLRLVRRRGSCRDGQRLEAGERCQVVALAGNAARAGEIYGVNLSFQRQGVTTSRRLVFELPAQPPGRH